MTNINSIEIEHGSLYLAELGATSAYSCLVISFNIFCNLERRDLIFAISSSLLGNEFSNFTA